MKLKRYQVKHLNKEKKRRYFPTTTLLVYLLIAVTLTTGVSFSRYTTSVSGSDSARVARFDVSIGIQSTLIELNGNLEPGFTKDYEFTVSNSGEVAIQYNFELTSTGNLPLTFELGTKGGALTQIKTDTVMDMGAIAPNNTTGTTYVLRVTWPENIRDAKYSGLVDALKLIVVATQVD